MADRWCTASKVNEAPFPFESQTQTRILEQGRGRKKKKKMMIVAMWMIRRNLWIVALFLLLSPLRRAAPESAKPRYDDCAPCLCGRQVISYPFWLIGRQQRYCGHPSFGLTCIDDTGALFLTVFNINFYVLRIFYSVSSVHFTLGDADSDSCAFFFGRNTTMVFPFSVTASNKQIFFLFDCFGPTSAIPGSYQNVSCPRLNTWVMFGGEYDPVRTRSPDANCSVGWVPVMGDSNVSAGSNYSALLRAGWIANYTAKDCSECADSGGRCGYDINNTKTRQGSICICRDGVHLGSCRSEYRPIAEFYDRITLSQFPIAEFRFRFRFSVLAAGRKNSHRILLAAGKGSSCSNPKP